MFNFFFDWPHSLTSPGICLPFPPEHSECTSSNLVVLRIWVFLGMPQVITARMEGNSGVQNPRGSCTLNSAMTAPLFCLHIILCKISFGKRKKINSLKFEKYNSSSLKIHSKEQYFMQMYQRSFYITLVPPSFLYTKGGAFKMFLLFKVFQHQKANR